MAIVINLDVELAKKKMSVTDLASAIGLAVANVSILKNGGPRPCGSRPWTPFARCSAVSRGTSSATWPTNPVPMPRAALTSPDRVAYCSASTESKSRAGLA